MYAVVKAGGKQYKVAKGDVLDLEKIEGEVGSTVELGPVLMTGDGETTQIGTPAVEGLKVEAKIVAQGKAPKIIILKHHKRKKYRRKQGHRQLITTVEITSVG